MDWFSHFHFLNQDPLSDWTMIPSIDRMNYREIYSNYQSSFEFHRIPYLEGMKEEPTSFHFFKDYFIHLPSFVVYQQETCYRLPCIRCSKSLHPTFVWMDWTLVYLFFLHWNDMGGTVRRNIPSTLTIGYVMTSSGEKREICWNYGVYQHIVSGYQWYLDVQRESHCWNRDYPHRIEFLKDVNYNKKDVCRISHVNSIQQEHFLLVENLYTVGDLFMSRQCPPRIGNDQYKIIRLISRVNQSINAIHYDSSMDYFPRKLKTMYDPFIREVGGSSSERWVSVDFETVSGFVNCIGVYDGTRTYTWYMEELTWKEQRRIMEEWIDFLTSKHLLSLRILHWGNAEVTWYSKIYTAIVSRFPTTTMVPCSDLHFVDVLVYFRKEPIVVKGAFTYSIKDIAKSLHQQGYIPSIWDDSSSLQNGLLAMQLSKSFYRTKDTSIQQEIIEYNRMDTRIVYDITSFMVHHLI